jgi:hypothetical protein
MFRTVEVLKGYLIVCFNEAPLLSGLESTEGGLYFGDGSTLSPGTFISGLVDDVRIYIVIGFA